MWTVLSVPPGRLFPIISKPISAATSASSQPSPHRRKQQQTAKKDRENQNQRGAVTNQLSGLDVLWAMQKAVDQKNRRTKKNRKRDEPEPESESLSQGGEREDSGTDYSNIRPLLIKDEWGARLDELEKCLQELSEDK